MSTLITQSEVLARAQQYERTMLTTQTTTAKPHFHVCAPTGWINDPNGFSSFGGETHLFFQYHPYKTVWGPMHWGHMKTTDFVRWEQLPVALAPDADYDGFGCFSGSAVTWQGKHVLIYTSVEEFEEDGEKKTYQTQSVAIGDGISYEKIPQNPVIDRTQLPENGNIYDFRDPKVWVDGDDIYMVVGNRTDDGTGQILLYHSLDFTSWTYRGVLAACAQRYGKMWECPDYFRLDNADVLLVSPQEMEGVEHEFHCGDGTLYIVGTLDGASAKLTEQSIHTIDGGLDFYAPQTMETPDGRRIMIAWMQSWRSPLFHEADGFCGMMTTPRELSVRDGVLYQLPIKELQHYYTNPVTLNSITVTDTLTAFECLNGRVQNIDITATGVLGARFELRLAANETYHTKLVYDGLQNTFTIDRTCCGIRADIAHERTVSLLSTGDTLKLRIVMDLYSVEVFVNDGERALTSIIRTPMEADGVFMKASKAMRVSVTKHDIEVYGCAN